MDKSISMAIDAMGGDNSPDKVIEGISLHSKFSENVSYKIFGNEKLISPLIKKYNISIKRFELTHTDKIVELLESLGVYNMFPDRMEGDDVIAWLSDQNNESVIVSADQDMYQLVTGTTKVYNPIKKIEVNSVNFKDVTGVNVDDFVLYKSLIGDKSDNIKGLPRVGKKTAIKYISNWDKTLKKLTESNLQQVKDNITLMDLRYGYNYYDTEVISYKKQYKEQEDIVYDKNAFLKLCKEHNLHNISKDVNWSDCFSHGVEDAVVSVIEALGLQNK